MSAHASSLHGSAILALLLLSACPTRAPDRGAPSALASAEAPVEATAAAPVDLLAPFLEAARSNLQRPYPAAAKERYAEAARALPDTVEHNWSSAQIVADVLDRSTDPRAAPALVRWASAKETSNEHRLAALQHMRGNLRPAYLEAIVAILANPDLASAITITGGTAYCEALAVGAKVSQQAMALEIAVAIPGPRGRALVEGVADDRSLSAPNPRTLAALVCEPGQTRIDDEAQAVASLRLMALSALRDKARLGAIAKDPSEAPLMRRWAARMARGLPVTLDARAKRTVRGPPGEDPITMPWLAPSPCP